MKRLATLFAVAVAAIVVAILFFWPSTTDGPVPIRYGLDTCDTCRMIISRPGFGAELRDERGTVTRYDDIGCMLQAMARMHRDIPEAWVEDGTGDGFVALLAASFVRGAKVETPMGYGIVAFKNETDAQTFIQLHEASLVVLEDLLRNPPGKAGAQEDNGVHR